MSILLVVLRLNSIFSLVQFTIYVFQFWPIRELETITQPFLFFRCTYNSLVQSHYPNGQNDSENVPTYISTNIVGNYDIIVPNDAKIVDKKME